MTTEEIALVIIGAVVNAGTFAAGVLMGVSLHRKDAKDECDSDKEAKGGVWKRDRPEPAGSQGGARLRVAGSAEQEREAGASERAPVGRGAVWE